MSEHFDVHGGARLVGEVDVVGAKNSVLKLMAAALLAETTTIGVRRTPVSRVERPRRTVTVSTPQPAATLPEPQTVPSANDPRSRDNQRSRDGR